VRQRRRHLAHRDQARGALQALFLLACHLGGLLAVGDVGGDAHAHHPAIDPARGLLAHVVPTP